MIASKLKIITKCHFLVLLLAPLSFYCQPLLSDKSSTFTIVIDAGHGGHDTGAKGAQSKEKDVALQIALQIGDVLKSARPDFQVVYTRSTDVFIPLNDRVQLANDLKADLFVSIHCNSVSRSVKASGTETFVMGLHSSQENLNVAKRENAAILLEQDYKSNYEGFDPYSIEGHILLSALQNSHLNQSIEVAQMIQDKLGNHTVLNNRGVKQAGFLLLRKATMPSILVETGFLSNSKDENYIVSKNGQLTISNAISQGIIEYAKYIINTNSLASEGQMIDTAESKTSIITEKESFESKLASKTASKENKIKKEQPSDDKLVYCVQIASTKAPMDIRNHRTYSSLKNVIEKYEDNLYKYLFGSFEELSQAVVEKQKLREQGFNGAFVVAYQGNKRIKL